MDKPIGGFFDIDVLQSRKKSLQNLNGYFHIRQGRSRWVNSGRSALIILFEMLAQKGRKILLPDYLCFDIFESVVRKTKIKPKFYTINQDLKADRNCLEGQLSKTGPWAVVLINYFGITDHRETVAFLRGRYPDVVIIQDCVQDPYFLSMQPAQDLQGDYIFTSFRKAFAVVDGALIQSRGKMFGPVRLSSPDADYFSNALAAGLIKNMRVSSHAKEMRSEKLMLRLFNKAQGLLGFDPRRINPFSIRCLERIDFDAAKAVRRANYRYLVKKLKGQSNVQIIRKQLDPRQVPLFCPVYVLNGQRNRLRQYLQDREIFCPVHWPNSTPLFKEFVGEKSQWMADHMLSLVIDQRYNTEDMDRMISVIHQFKGN